MALFTISDLHLSLNTNKSMEVFGGVWKDYIEKLEYNWNNLVKKDANFKKIAQENHLI